MIKIISTFFIVIFICGFTGKDLYACKVDQSNPESILEAIFFVAKNGNCNDLKNICDPLGKNDGDTKRICNLQTSSKKYKKDFKKWFSSGKIIGKAKIKGNKAQVDFIFGPNANKKETMNFIKRGNKWYLYSF